MPNKAMVQQKKWFRNIRNILQLCCLPAFYQPNLGLKSISWSLAKEQTAESRNDDMMNP